MLFFGKQPLHMISRVFTGCLQDFSGHVFGDGQEGRLGFGATLNKFGLSYEEVPINLAENKGILPKLVLVARGHCLLTYII